MTETISTATSLLLALSAPSCIQDDLLWFMPIGAQQPKQALVEHACSGRRNFTRSNCCSMGESDTQISKVCIVECVSRIVSLHNRQIAGPDFGISHRFMRCYALFSVITQPSLILSTPWCWCWLAARSDASDWPCILARVTHQ